MKFASKRTEAGEYIAVDATGKGLGNDDADCRLFHVLPKLFVPHEALAFLKREWMRPRLAVSSTLPCIVPEGGVVIRQPYPNRRYFVGGSNQTRNGWVIRLPDKTQDFTITFEWLLPMCWPWIGMDAEHWTVQHEIHIKLMPGERRFFTMDASCWPRADDKPGYSRSPITLIGHRDDADSIPDERMFVSDTPIVDEDDVVIGKKLEERLEIPPIAYEQAWTLREHEEEQLHEVQHQSALSEDGTVIHRANACIDMPASVFLEAVRLACATPYDKDSDFYKSQTDKAGAYERHPAHIHLAKWWKTNRPSGEGLQGAFALPYVRVQDDGQYWCGYYETPNADLSDFSDCSKAGATVGDAILLLFHASWKDYHFDEHGMTVRLADGQDFSTVCVGREEMEKGEMDESWYALEALAGFPHRFPVTYHELIKKASESADG